jgi:hypothetical protein
MPTKTTAVALTSTLLAACATAEAHEAEDPPSPARAAPPAPIGHLTVVAQTVRIARAVRRRLRGRRLDVLKRRVRNLRRDLHEAREARAAASVSPALQAIAACESGGNPAAIGGGGAYRGKYQFSFGTWASVGGTGDPAAAPEAEQDRRAAMLYARAGASPWPVCGR